eukprot:2495787-Amphidinium_carterae.1
MEQQRRSRGETTKLQQKRATGGLPASKAKVRRRARMMQRRMVNKGRGKGMRPRREEAVGMESRPQARRKILLVLVSWEQTSS